MAAIPLTPELMAEIVEKYLDPIEQAEVATACMIRTEAFTAMCQVEGGRPLGSREEVAKWLLHTARRVASIGEA